MRVALFVPCFVDTLFPQVGVAAVHLLERVGIHIEYPAEQTCCGQPQFNAGLSAEARELAERFCRIFSPYDAIVTPSGSCAAMVRAHYPSLVGDHPVCGKVYELCELLVDVLGVTDVGARLRGRAALHVGCHAAREIAVGPAVRSLVDRVDGLTVVDCASDAWCCGFGGTFSVKFPELSAAMGKRKLAPIQASNVDYLISTDASCLMHLGGLLRREGCTRPRPVHVAEVLAGAVEEP